MSEDSIPEFEIRVDQAGSPAPDHGQAGDESILGLRGSLEWYYAEAKKCQQASHRRQKEIVMGLIGLADVFEDLFHMAEEDEDFGKNLRHEHGGRPSAEKALQMTYETLKELLTKEGAHQVPILGKSYRDVQFQGTPIPEPWEVVAVKKTDRENEGKAARPQAPALQCVRKVLRSLWVWVVNGQLRVLRRGQVSY